MRIAIIGSKGIPGHHGVEVVVENVATRLVALGHEISVLGYNSYFKGLETYKDCNLIGFDGSDHYSFEMPTHVKNEVKYLLGHSQDYDVVHIHSVDPCLFTLSLKKVFPIVVTSHGRVYKRREVGIVRKLAS
ncbi:glycosyltransferase, partial [bacterium]|nr:glycosyltransferase [bacterium]